MGDTKARQYGMGRGKVFPAAKAKSLVNPLRRLVQSPARTVAAMSLPTTARVVEIGAGPGFFSPYLARAVPGGELIVVDLQLEMLRLASDRLLGLDNVVLATGDAMALPLRSASVDAAVLATVLGEVPELSLCLNEARRALRPGGVLVVAETRRDSDFIAVDDLRALVEPVGFRFEGRRGPAWQYVARFVAEP